MLRFLLLWFISAVGVLNAGQGVGEGCKKGGVYDYGVIMGRYAVGDIVGAKVCMNLAVLANRGDWLWLYRRGDLYMLLGDRERAVGDLLEAGRLNARLWGNMEYSARLVSLGY